MVRVARVLFLVLAAIIGLGGPSIASPPDSVSAVKASYTYDSHPRPAALALTASERDPLATYDRVTNYNAVDAPSHGASARQGRDGAIAYDDLAQLARTTIATATTQEQAQVADAESAVIGRTGVAANGAIRVRPPLSIPKSQFGAKWGKHAADYGLDAGDSAARAAWTSRIRDVHLNPDEVRLGQYGVYDEAFMFRQGEDLLITRTDGTFVSMYPGGSTSSWFKGAEVFPH